jgi:hypothetical protein
MTRRFGAETTERNGESGGGAGSRAREPAQQTEGGLAVDPGDGDHLIQEFSLGDPGGGLLVARS